MQQRIFRFELRSWDSTLKVGRIELLSLAGRHPRLQRRRAEESVRIFHRSWPSHESCPVFVLLYIKTPKCRHRAVDTDGKMTMKTTKFERYSGRFLMENFSQAERVLARAFLVNIETTKSRGFRRLSLCGPVVRPEVSRGLSAFAPGQGWR